MTHTPETPEQAAYLDAPPPYVPATMAGEAATAVPSEAETASLADAPAPRKPRTRWIWPTLAGLSLAGMAGLSTYLAVVAFQWSDRVDELTIISKDLGATVAEANAAKDAAIEERSVMETQLETAKARITELANEEANANDSESVLIEYVDAMAWCADQRQVIIDVLTDSSLYFPGSSAGQVERETTAECDQILADFEAYKVELGQ